VASAPTDAVPTPEEVIAELRGRVRGTPAAKPAGPATAKRLPPPEPRVEPVEPTAKPPKALPVEEPIRPERRGGAVVQVAAYREVEAAQTLVRRLRRAGYDAYLSDQRATGPNKYRVRVQPPPGSKAKSLADTLADRGYGVWVTNE
jgi:cell division septation protein DedD